MPVGAAPGVRLSGARVPHGGRTLAAVAVPGRGSSLSPPTSVHHEVRGRRSAKRPEQRRRACVEAYEAMLMERRDSCPSRRGHIFRLIVGVVVDAGAECAQKDAADSS